MATPEEETTFNPLDFGLEPESSEPQFSFDDFGLEPETPEPVQMEPLEELPSFADFGLEPEGVETAQPPPPQEFSLEDFGLEKEDQQPSPEDVQSPALQPVLSERTDIDPQVSVSRNARNRILDLKRELKSDITIERRDRLKTQLERLERLSGELDRGNLQANRLAREERKLAEWYIPAREMFGGLTLGVGDNIFEALEESDIKGLGGGSIDTESSAEDIIAGTAEALGMVMSGRVAGGKLAEVVRSPNTLKKMMMVRGGTAALQAGVNSIVDVVDGNISAKDGAINLGTSIFSSLVPIIPETMVRPGVANFLSQVATDVAVDMFSDTFFRKKLFQSGQKNDWAAWTASEIPNMIMSAWFALLDNRPGNKDSFKIQQDLTKADFRKMVGRKTLNQMRSRAKDVEKNSDIKQENEDFINNVGRVHGELNHRLKQAIRENRLTEDQKQKLADDEKGGESALFSDDAILRNVDLPVGWKMEIVDPKTAQKMAGETFEVKPEKIGDIEGFADPIKKRIVITDQAKGVDRFEVALHEVGHAKYSKDNNGEEGSDILSRVREAIKNDVPDDRIEAEFGILPETVRHMRQYLNDNLFRKQDLAEEAWVAEKSLREFNGSINDLLRGETGRVSDDAPAVKFDEASDESMAKVVEEQPEVVTSKAIEDVESISTGAVESSPAVKSITKVDSDGAAPGVKPEGDLPPVKNTDSEIPGERPLTETQKYRDLIKAVDENDADTIELLRGPFSNSPEGQRILAEIDAYRESLGLPGTKTRAEYEAEAKVEFEKNADMQIDRLLSKNNGQTTDLDVALARLAYDEQIRRAGEVKSVEEDAKVALMAMNIREAGTERGRALAARRLPQDPADYNRRMIMGALFEPDAKQRKRLSGMTPDEQILQLQNSQGKNKAVEALRKEGIDIFNLSREDFADPIFAAQVARVVTTAKAKKLDMAYEWWINSILSSPATHVTNVFGNTLNALWEYGPQRIGEALLSDALVGLRVKKTPKKRAEAIAKREGHEPDTASFNRRVNELTTEDLSATASELSAMYSAVFPAMSRAFSNARQTFQAEMPIHHKKLDAEGPSKLEMGSRSAKIPGRFGRITRWPARFLQAQDVMAKTIVSQMEVAAQAHRIAKAKTGSVEGDAFIREMRHQMENPASQAWKEASQKADEVTFQNVGKDDKVHQAITGLRGIPGMRYVLPFVTTPLNIAKLGFARSPLGGLRFIKNITDMANGKSIPNKKIERQTVEMMYAIFSMFALMELMSEDESGRPRITGTFEGDSGAEKKFVGQNIPSQSIRIFNPLKGEEQWVKYNRIEPVGTSIALTVDFLDALKGVAVDKDLNLAKRFASTSLGVIKDKTFLKGVSDLIKVTEDPDRYAFNWAKNFAGSWTPNWIRAGMRNADPLVRDSKIRDKGWDATLKGLKRTGQAAVPLQQFAPPSRVDVWGRPVEKGQSGVNPFTDWAFQMLSPVQLRKADTFTDIDRAILNYNNSLGPDDDKWWPSVPQGTIKHMGESFPLSEELYFEYATRSGQLAQELTEGMAASIDSINPTERDIQRVKDMFSRARNLAKRELLANHPEFFVK